MPPLQREVGATYCTRRNWKNGKDIKSLPFLALFHIGEGNRKVPGKGMLPWNEIGQALRDINYQHAAVMEPFVMQGGTVGHDIKIWRDIIGNCSEVTLDMDAQSALHFVKHVFEV